MCVLREKEQVRTALMGGETWFEGPLLLCYTVLLRLFSQAQVPVNIRLFLSMKLPTELGNTLVVLR